MLPNSDSIGIAVLYVLLVALALASLVIILIAKFVKTNRVENAQAQKPKYPLIRAMVIGFALAILTFGFFFGWLLMSNPN